MREKAGGRHTYVLLEACHLSMIPLLFIEAHASNHDFGIPKNGTHTSLARGIEGSGLQLLLDVKIVTGSLEQRNIPESYGAKETLETILSVCRSSVSASRWLDGM